MGKVTLWSCGCALVALLTLVGFIAAGIFAAFSGLRAPGTGGTTQVVWVEKVASPREIPVGPNQEVTFSITVHNQSKKEITNLKVVDDYDQDNISSLSVLGGGSDDGDKWTFDDPVTKIPPGGKADVSYRAWVIADENKTVVNTATFTGTMDGLPVSDTRSAFVIVGSGGEGRPPSGWPLTHGRITQGPFAPGGKDSHRSQAAIDIAAPLDSAVLATHDGTVALYRNCSGPYPVLGDYVIITSPKGFRSIYGHLLDISVGDGWTVAADQKIGSVGGIGAPACQKSTGAHLHYEFEGLPMEPPYIPRRIDPCLNASDCDYEF